MLSVETRVPMFCTQFINVRSQLGESRIVNQVSFPEIDQVTPNIIAGSLGQPPRHALPENLQLMLLNGVDKRFPFAFGACRSKYGKMFILEQEDLGSYPRKKKGDGCKGK